MHFRHLVLLFFMFVPGLFAMDAETSIHEDDDEAGQAVVEKIASIKGITVADGVSLLLNNKHIDPWDAPTVGLNLLFAFGISFLAPALLPGLPASLLGCSMGGMQSPLCKFGLCSVSTPLLTGLAAACYLPITWAHNSFADHCNDQAKRRINRDFSNARDLQGELDEEDIRVIGYILAANDRTDCCRGQLSHPQRGEIDALLGKLSPRQALALAPFGRGILANLAQNKFSESARTLVEHLLLLLDKDADALADALLNKEVVEQFVHEPSLWQALVYSLPLHMRNDEGVQKGLKLLLQAIMKDAGLESCNIDLEDVMDNVAQGMPLRSYILKEVATERHDAEDQVVVPLTSGSIVASKKDLIGVSQYFKIKFSKNWSHKDLALDEIDKDWIHIVFTVANRQGLTLNNANIWDALQAATYFQMPELITQCDRFIRDRGLGRNLLKSWWDQEDNDDEAPFDENSFSLKWRFCISYSLSEEKAQLMSELVQRLNNLSPKDLSGLDDIKALAPKDRERVVSGV